MLKRILVLWMLVFSVILALPKAECSTDIIKTYTVNNDTAQEATTYIATTTLIPNQVRIYGFSVSPTRPHAFSSYATLWDMTSTSRWDYDSQIGEVETVAHSTQDKMFAFPKNISNQVKVVLGPYSSVTIEYTK